MTIERLLATNARDGRYMDMIRAAFDQTQPRQICAAVAYATHSGVAELDAALSGLQGWQEAKKRWLVGIDYCRSDPLALAHLSNLPKSKVRIFDGGFVAKRKGCVPRNSYHPKAYLLLGGNQSAAVVGSGNLSRTGLLQGIEAAAVAAESRLDAIEGLRSWFNNHWRLATPFRDIGEEYGKQHGSIENRRHPMASEEDAVPESASKRGQLGPGELRKLRVCSHFWIKSGKLSDTPGNQLNMKRNTRVFFGFELTDVEPNSSIGSVAIDVEGHRHINRPLRFGHNSMDMLYLPVPGDDVPDYRQQFLHFERIGTREFALTVGRPGDVRGWMKRSQAINGKFELKSGRPWGVY